MSWAKNRNSAKCGKVYVSNNGTSSNCLNSDGWITNQPSNGWISNQPSNGWISNQPSNGWMTNQHPDGWITHSYSGDDWGLPPELDNQSTASVKRKELKTFDNPKTHEVAIDCEMVEATSNLKRFSVLARVSIINSNCQPLLDTYVDPMCYVSDYRTAYSGILPEHLLGAPTYDDVREHVINLLSHDCILIGHDLKQDLAVLGIKNIPRSRLRDTSRCYLSYFKPNEKPSLKRLAEAVLGQTIQTGAHNSMEDAKVSMILWKHWLTLGRKLEDAMPPEPKHKKNKNSNAK